MSLPNHGYTGPVLPRPIMRSDRPPARCCSIAYSSAMRTGSFVVMSVVDVERMIRSVCAAMYARVVVGDDEKNGGLWCSPIANTSSPASSACFAIATASRIRCASLGVSPVTGSRVMSLTLIRPNCMPGQVVSLMRSPLLSMHLNIHDGTQATPNYSRERRKPASHRETGFREVD